MEKDSQQPQIDQESLANAYVSETESHLALPPVDPFKGSLMQENIQSLANQSTQVQQQRAIQRMANRSSIPAALPAPLSPFAKADASPLQRKLFKEGSGTTGSVSVPGHAKSMARYVTSKTSIQAGGKLHIANIQNRGFPGFKLGKDEYAGGRPFGGNMTDGNKLPSAATYQEWDITPCPAGGNRGVERIVTSSDGKCYYTNNHYTDFTEFAI